MIYDCVVIGSGVAGLTAGLYLARANKSVMIIENGVLGGTTATLDIVENYPGFNKISGNELIQKIMTQVMNLGVNIDFLNINSIDYDKKIIDCGKTSIKYKALIIASGQSVNKLNIPKEEEYRFKGLSYCAICDGALYKQKNIVVVTNGMLGKSSVEYLEGLTDNLIVVDYQDSYKSVRHKVYSNSQIIDINGTGFVESITIKDMNTLKETKINTDAIFVCLGRKTNLDLYKDFITCKDGYIVSDENMHTNIDSVFVAGDVRYKTLRQIITACSDGAIAATEVIKYLSKSY
ncbi:MAG: FAD-dependent oxidoreductase [Clostridia bacterium]|nr:FAD-dependent oxidoreductase [Clostridia bacterium]